MHEKTPQNKNVFLVKRLHESLVDDLKLFSSELSQFQKNTFSRIADFVVQNKKEKAEITLNRLCERYPDLAIHKNDIKEIINTFIKNHQESIEQNQVNKSKSHSTSGNGILKNEEHISNTPHTTNKPSNVFEKSLEKQDESAEDAGVYTDAHDDRYTENIPFFRGKTVMEKQNTREYTPSQEYTTYQEAQMHIPESINKKIDSGMFQAFLKELHVGQTFEDEKYVYTVAELIGQDIDLVKTKKTFKETNYSTHIKMKPETLFEKIKNSAEEDVNQQIKGNSNKSTGLAQTPRNETSRKSDLNKVANIRELSNFEKKLKGKYFKNWKTGEEIKIIAVNPDTYQYTQIGSPEIYTDFTNDLKKSLEDFELIEFKKTIAKVSPTEYKKLGWSDKNFGRKSPEEQKNILENNITFESENTEVKKETVSKKTQTRTHSHKWNPEYPGYQRVKRRDGGITYQPLFRTSRDQTTTYDPKPVTSMGDNNEIIEKISSKLSTIPDWKDREISVVENDTGVEFRFALKDRFGHDTLFFPKELTGEIEELKNYIQEHKISSINEISEQKEPTIHETNTGELTNLEGVKKKLEAEPYNWPAQLFEILTTKEIVEINKAGQVYNPISDEPVYRERVRQYKIETLNNEIADIEQKISKSQNRIHEIDALLNIQDQEISDPATHLEQIIEERAERLNAELNLRIEQKPYQEFIKRNPGFEKVIQEVETERTVMIDRLKEEKQEAEEAEARELAEKIESLEENAQSLKKILSIHEFQEELEYLMKNIEASLQDNNLETSRMYRTQLREYLLSPLKEIEVRLYEHKNEQNINPGDQYVTQRIKFYEVLKQKIIRVLLSK